jgi:O-antigen biosynthesis protein
MDNSDFEVILYGGSDIDAIDNNSYRYRILYLKEQLDYGGIKSKIITNLSQITKMSNDIKRILVLHRIPWDAEVSSVIKFAKVNFIPVVYDIDDYVFDSAVYQFIRGVDAYTDEQKNEYFSVIEGYRQTLLACDFAIVSTIYLKNIIEKEGIKTFVHRNALSKEQVEISEKIKNSKNSNDIILGYFSGSYSHNYDFSECSIAIKEILEKFKHVKLLIVGPLDLPEYLKKFTNQIIKKDLVHWKDLPNLIATVNINLIPLEMNNPICKAKSEQKFFEAGIVKVPTISSPIESYNNAIKNYENGFLASNTNEWQKYLEELIQKNDLRKKIADESFKSSITHYTYKSRSKEIQIIFNEIWNNYLFTKQDKNKINDLLETSDEASLIEEINSLKSSISKLNSRLNQIEPEITTLTESYMLIKNRLIQIDYNLHQFSKIFPINLCVKLFKKFKKKSI